MRGVVRARRLTCDERNAHPACRSLEQGHNDRILSTESPVRLRDRERRLLEPLVQIRRDVHLDPHFLWIPWRLWIRTRDQHATVREERCLRMIKPCDDRVAEDGETLTDGLGWVVQDRIVVGIGRQSESSNALVGAIEDQVRSASKFCKPHTQ